MNAFTHTIGMAVVPGLAWRAMLAGAVDVQAQAGRCAMDNYPTNTRFTKSVFAVGNWAAAAGAGRPKGRPAGSVAATLPVFATTATPR